METLAGLFPVIFLGVAAFLLNVVVTRLAEINANRLPHSRRLGTTTSQSQSII